MPLGQQNQIKRRWVMNPVIRFALMALFTIVMGFVVGLIAVVANKNDQLFPHWNARILVATIFVSMIATALIGETALHLRGSWLYYAEVATSFVVANFSISVWVRFFRLRAPRNNDPIRP